MKYLQKGPFTVTVGGGDNYDATFGRKCFYCRKPIDQESGEEYENNAHAACDPDKKSAA